MKVRAFAVDVDGTLTNQDLTLHLEAAHVARWLQDGGYEVILVSGRGPYDTYALSNFMGLSKVVVAENGGVIAFSPSELQILGNRSICEKAYELLRQRLNDVRIGTTFPRLSEVRLERSFEHAAAKKLLDEWNMNVQIIDSGYAYHLIEKGVDKARGLSIALKYLRLGFEETVAIGDSDTDIPMFRACGYSVAIGNAPESARKEASHSVGRGFGLGFVDAVQHVLRLRSEESRPKHSVD